MEHIMEYEEYIRTKFRYDPDTGIIYRKFKGFEKRTGSIDKEGYRRVRIAAGRQIQEHRLAWFIYYGRWPEKHLDHINRDKQDNRIENLRECDDYLNAANQPKNKCKTSTSKYKGVGRYKGKWRARIKHRGKRMELGVFKTEEEAFAVYAFKAAELHGEFINVGFVDDGRRLLTEKYNNEMRMQQSRMVELRSKFDLLTRQISECGSQIERLERMMKSL